MIIAQMKKAALALALFAAGGTAFLAITNNLTHEQVAENKRQTILRNLNALVPAAQHDNDMYTDSVQVMDREYLGSKDPVTVFLARQGGMPVAAVFEAVAPDGYSGAIKLLIAIHYDGTVAGVRVVSHKETPGLGDYIEKDRSNWILSFDGRSLFNPTKPGWRVKKDGGVFDQVSGATVTPRAVVKAVYKCLQYFSQHKDELFTMSKPTSGGANNEH